MRSGRYERVNYTYLKLVSICPEIEDTKRLNTTTVTTLLKTSFLAKKNTLHWANASWSQQHFFVTGQN